VGERVFGKVVEVSVKFGAKVVHVVLRQALVHLAIFELVVRLVLLVRVADEANFLGAGYHNGFLVNYVVFFYLVQVKGVFHDGLRVEKLLALVVVAVDFSDLFVSLALHTCIYYHFKVGGVHFVLGCYDLSALNES
jgi:hypothetical protein